MFFYSFSAYAQGETFDWVQWNNRVLVLSASNNSPQADEQILLFSDHLDAIEERELIILRLTGQVFGKVPGLSPFPFETKIFENGQERRYLQSLFTAEFGDDLQITLVGFDGEIKQVWHGVVEPADVFDVIDTMPMRQQELNSK